MQHVECEVPEARAQALALSTKLSASFNERSSMTKSKWAGTDGRFAGTHFLLCRPTSSQAPCPRRMIFLGEGPQETAHGSVLPGNIIREFNGSGNKITRHAGSQEDRLRMLCEPVTELHRADQVSITHMDSHISRQTSRLNRDLFPVFIDNLDLTSSSGRVVVTRLYH